MNQVTMDEPPHQHDDTNTTLPAVPTAMTPIDPPPSKQRPAGSGAGRIIAAGVAMVVLGFGGGVGGYYAADHWFGNDDSSTAAALTIQPSNTSAVSSKSSGSDTETPRSIYAKVAPAVVHIEARIEQQGQSFFGIPTAPQEEVGTGSGFVIDDKGHIVTNAHVVADAKSLSVSFGDDLTVSAKVVGIDKSSDLAVIQVDTGKLKGLKGGLVTVPFGDSKALHIGDPVMAIGNPFSLDRTLTTGVVSALQRDIPALNSFSISDVIQTDAAVNPGNSGGPLLNMQGQVVGVNSQIESKGGGNDGIAFAIPSDTVARIAKTLIEDGKVSYAWLGVEGGTLTDDIRTKAHLKHNQQGVMVGSVTQGSPAAKAGIVGQTSDKAYDGDVITEFDGKKLDEMQQLGDLVNDHKAGDQVQVVILRDGKPKTVTVTLGSRPDNLGSSSDDSSGSDQGGGDQGGDDSQGGGFNPFG